MPKETTSLLRVWKVARFDQRVLCCALDGGVFFRAVVIILSGILMWLLYTDVHIS